MVWYKAAWIVVLFAAVDLVYPQRQHGQDGTIGDSAHQLEVSGHNPDDTPGVRAERQDADTRPEVRAADFDIRGLTHAEALALALSLVGDPRLIYVIFDRHIWRASNGWVREDYGGSDPHDTHIHASGHPDADDNSGPWPRVLALGGHMELTDSVQQPDPFAPPSGWFPPPSTVAAPQTLSVAAILGGLSRTLYLSYNGLVAIWGRAGAILSQSQGNGSGISVLTARVAELRTVVNGLATPTVNLSEADRDAIVGDLATRLGALRFVADQPAE